MAKTYYVRKVCETEIGDGMGWHYFWATQPDTPDENISCPDHPQASTKDFVIEYVDETGSA